MPDENGCFAYGEKETEYLKKKDKKLAEVIDRVGHVYRKTDPDLFSLSCGISWGSRFPRRRRRLSGRGRWTSSAL